MSGKHSLHHTQRSSVLPNIHKLYYLPDAVLNHLAPTWDVGSSRYLGFKGTVSNQKVSSGSVRIP